MTETEPVTPPAHRSRARLQRLRVPLGFLTAFLFLFAAQPMLRSLLLGAPVALLGALIRAWASGHLRKNAELAVSGPYAHTRNPLYFGSFVMTVGLAICGGVLWTGLMLVGFFLLVYLPVMRAEAEHMQTLFGAEYTRWASAVPLFAPRLTPYASGQNRRFSWRQYLHHREWRACVGLLIVLLLLCLKVFFLPR